MRHIVLTIGTVHQFCYNTETAAGVLSCQSMSV